MNWELIQLIQAPSVLWKNGGGTTRELLMWPNPENWIWRISVAEVASDGPFSKFEGIQRWFSVLKGAGVQLHYANETVLLTGTSPAFNFDGAAVVNCQLISGSTQDINLMVSKSDCRGSMSRVTTESKFALNASKCIAVYAIHGDTKIFCKDTSMVVPVDTLAWCRGHEEVELIVNSTNAIVMELTT